jgi:hypothetical protein
VNDVIFAASTEYSPTGLYRNNFLTLGFFVLADLFDRILQIFFADNVVVKKN